MKRAAMFGLDARIALAIFGALSVISGAALYSAISNAKATAFLADMREVGKAWESYYLDTGRMLGQRSTNNSEDNFYRYRIVGLQENVFNLKGWAGPYLPYSYNTYNLFYPAGEDLHMLMLTEDNAWGATTWNGGKCVSGTKCYAWVYINGLDGSLAPAIDEIVDGGDGATSGNFRYFDSTHATWKYSYVLKISQVENPND
tara:strand:- start:3625 stop:4227 length:603 start_codon:yes stop_codon:yes gene_type:complete